jgi:tetratricopeptide (TPR) repeat protein
MTQYEICVALDPSDPYLYLLTGAQHVRNALESKNSRKEEDLNAALRYFDRGLSLQPDADYLIGAKLEVYRELKRFGEADQCLDDLAEMNPKALRLPLYRALRACDAGDWSAALGHVEKFQIPPLLQAAPGLVSASLSACGQIYELASKDQKTERSVWSGRLLNQSLRFSRQSAQIFGHVAPTEREEDVKNWEKLLAWPEYKTRAEAIGTLR